MSRHAEFGYWSPQDCDRFEKPQVGDVVAWDFKPWRLVGLRDDDRVKEGDREGEVYRVWVLRPPHLDPTATAVTGDVHLRGVSSMYLDKIREHYGLCVHCQELLPCRALMAERQARREVKYMQRFETAGVCPACLTPVTHRMASETFPNVVVPLGPDVTFHAGRVGCRSSLERYRERCAQPESQLRLDGGHPF